MSNDDRTVPHHDSADTDGKNGTTGHLVRGAGFNRYIILGEIGTGGMGIVYAAYDPVLDRKVALKILNEMVADEAAEQRLMREAQAMARLSHPNVVAVHDAGTHEGRPFVAMEFIEGSDLETWLRSEERPWEKIVALFVEAGDGLAAAHAAGLVHRDFKPSNVMVGSDGRARVTDFGLARAATTGDSEATAPLLVTPSVIDKIDPSARHLDTPLTLDGTILGTPAYMAPEQIFDTGATELSDQFSFCVSLWVALYGHHPFGSFASMASYASRVARGDIEPPPEGHGVPSHINTALQKGMSADPGDRFPALDDLLQVLRSDALGGRRRWIVAGIAALALAAAAVVTVLYIGNRRQLCSAGDAQIAGVWNPRRAQELERAWVRVAGGFGSEAASAVSGHMDRYAKSWAAVYREACEATRIRGERSEDLLDRQMACLARRHVEADHLLSLVEEGDRDLVTAALDAVRGLPSPESCGDTTALVERVPRPDAPEVRAALEVLETEAATAEAERLAGEYQGCLSRLQQLAPRAREIDYPPALAEILVLKGSIEAALGQADDARTSLLEAVIAAEQGRDDRTGALAASDLMWVTGYLGDDFDEALRWGELADAKVSRVGGDEQSATSIADNRAGVLLRAGRYDEARAAQEHSLELQRLVHGPDSLDAAVAMTTMGNVLSSIGEFGAAVDYYRESLGLKERHVGSEHPTVAATLVSLAQAYGELERIDEMYDCAQRALAIQEHAFGDDHPQIAIALNNLAYALEDLDRLEEARAAHERSIAIVTAAWGPQHPQLAYSLLNLSSLEKRAGDLEAALADSRRAGDILVAAFGPDHPMYAYAANNTGVFLMLTGRASEAVPHLEKALSIRSDGSVDPVLLEVTRFNLGRALWEAGQRQQGRALVRQAEQGLVGAGAHAQDDLEAVREWLVEH